MYISVYVHVQYVYMYSAQAYINVRVYMYKVGNIARFRVHFEYTSTCMCKLEVLMYHSKVKQTVHNLHNTHDQSSSTSA